MFKHRRPFRFNCFALPQLGIILEVSPPVSFYIQAVLPSVCLFLNWYYLFCSFCSRSSSAYRFVRRSGYPVLAVPCYMSISRVPASFGLLYSPVL